MILNIVLYLGHTIGSVSGLLLLKTHLSIVKQGIGSQIPWMSVTYVCFGAALYIISFSIWLVILSRSELSIAYPVSIGLTLIFSTVASWLILSEAISAMRLGGMMLIFAGIIVVVRS